MTTDFDSLIAGFTPVVAAPRPVGWEGPIPPVITAFVAKCYTTRVPEERKITDLKAADDLQAVCRAACEAHDPQLSLRFVRTYAPLVKDGKPVLGDDGKPVDDTEKLVSVRISATKYSPRGGGVKAQRKAAADAVRADATGTAVTVKPTPAPRPTSLK